MKKRTNQQECLKKIMEILKQGEVFGYFMNFRKEDYHNPYHLPGGYMENIVLRMDDEYIWWYHFGSSANTISLKNLKFIITVIFHLKPSEFLEKYVHGKRADFWKKSDELNRNLESELIETNDPYYLKWKEIWNK